ncbi:MAG: DNA repair protein RecO [bacterium]|nr:DNA repair protein RecO [bacterium]
MLQSGPGIVLNRRNAGEADAIGRVLFESGEAREVRSHGVRKSKSRSNLLLEPGSLVHLTYYQSEERPGVSADAVIFASLKEGHVVERFASLKEDGYDGLLVLSYFLELANFGSRAGDSPELFLLLKGTLEELATPCEAGLKAFRFTMLSIFFKVRVLKILGLVGDARSCAECGGELREEALWNVPEVFFSCDACASDANIPDAYSARVVAAAAGMRYGKFAEYLAGWRNSQAGSLADKALAADELQTRAADADSVPGADDTPRAGRGPKKDLPPWVYHTEERLLQCMEHYQGGPMRAATQLREQLRI